MKDKRRETIDKVFSRKVLGAAFMTGAAGKIIEKTIGILAPTPYTQLIAWTIAFVLAFLLYLYWQPLEDRLTAVKNELLGRR